MADPFLAEIRIVSFDFAPKGWALCNGQLLAINQNLALFSLLGTTYGGDGTSTFALPNLQGAAPLGFGQGPGLSLYDQGQTGGEAAVTLLTSELPAHTHTVSGLAAPGTSAEAGGMVWAEPGAERGAAPPIYTKSASGLKPMGTGALATAGAGQPHNNMPPYLTLNFVIALQGLFPPRT